MNRQDFPIFGERELVYLDSAATTQKPRQVIQAMEDFYTRSCANPNRGAYQLGADATQCMEDSRENVRSWLHAASAQEIIFTKGTTESINMVAASYGPLVVQPGDQVAILISEHHANLLPWQRLCRQQKAELVYLYLDEDFAISEQEIQTKITSKTKLVAFAQISNALGIENPADKIIRRAHEVGAKVLMDAAQSVAHLPIDVQALDVDFLAFSAHKMYGPMGVGILYGKQEVLEQMPPYLLGGDMVEYVYEQEVTFNTLPHRLEAGTQNPAGAAGLSAAIDYLRAIGTQSLQKQDRMLLEYGQQQLDQLPYVHILGRQNPRRRGMLSLVVEGVHPHDLASIADSEKVCMRAGNHCAQPLLRYLNVNATTRMSFGIYNDKTDIDRAVAAIQKAKEMFRKWT